MTSQASRAHVTTDPLPVYATPLGQAYCGNASDLLGRIPDASINLIVTSPPFALRKKKEYGNVAADQYVSWFATFARQFYRILTNDGSLVIDVGGSWQRGSPIRSLYHFKLLIDLCEPKGDRGPFFLAQEFFWFNPAKLPSPAEWVTIRRVRCKDAVNPIWWLSKSHNPKADNRRVLTPYTESMKRLLQRGYNAGPRPSGHVVSEVYGRDNGGAIPPNILALSNTQSSSAYLRGCRANNIKPHPARYPLALPDFFMRFLTEPGDVVLDPFAGSNATGEAAEAAGRRWISFEKRAEYVQGSRYRFEAPEVLEGRDNGHVKGADTGGARILASTS